VEWLARPTEQSGPPGAIPSTDSDPEEVRIERNPMNRKQEQPHRWLLATMCVATMLVSACGTAGQPAQIASDSKEAPSRLEPIDGSDLSRVVLTDQAAKRLDIQTQPVSTEDVDGAQRTVIPCGAELYGAEFEFQEG
jgi:hypothetical protein